MDAYFSWYEKQYAENVRLPEFKKRTSGWLAESLNKFVFPYSSILRHEVLDNLKYHITPRSPWVKIEQ